ncbi:hypothetical protein ACFSX9_15465 [Flavobacterium ardleyense]|uniref:DUF805 domain-containing protein n=1 Tax=Flavobacterium ardleyense TaxID=2038737 RepID=A0ABW5ZDF7_9FLAO
MTHQRDCLNEYVDIWSNFKTQIKLTSRGDYWFFVLVNYALLTIFQHFFQDHYYLELLLIIGFVITTICIGFGRMNDIKKPIYFLFIPLYNLYLLLQPTAKNKSTATIESLQEGTMSNANFTAVETVPIQKKMFFLKFLIASIALAMLHLKINLTYEENVINDELAEILVYLVSIIIFIASFLALFILHQVLKKGISSSSLIIYFIASLTILNFLTRLLLQILFNWL